MPDETLLTLYQANQIRCELAAIWSDLRFKIGQLARLPTRACVSGLARWLRLPCGLWSRPSRCRWRRRNRDLISHSWRPRQGARDVAERRADLGLLQGQHRPPCPWRTDACRPKWQTVATARAKDRWETQGVRPSGSAAHYMVA